MRRASVRCLFAFLLAAVIVSGCGSNADGGSDETGRIKETVSSFLQEAYGPAGDLDFAYSLLAAETRETCSREDFEAMALAARAANGDRSLQPDRFGEIAISGDRAEVTIDADYDLSPSFFPKHATLVQEAGEWRYLVTSDPSCKSVVRFFEQEG